MTRSRRRPPDRRVPADVPLVAAFLLVANGIIALAPWQSLRVVPGLVLLLFAPGYALLTVLFPGRPDAEHSTVGGIDRLERAVLSFGVSVALVPVLYLLGYLFSRLNPPSTLMLLGVLDGFVVVTMALGYLRRRELSAPRRFDLPPRETVVPEVADRRTDRRGFLADLALGGAIVAAVGSLAYAISDPGDGERFTEFQLLSRTESGEYVAGDYRTVLTAGEPQSQIVGIENYEHARTTYTVVAELQRVDTEGDSAQLLERGDRTERTVSVAPGESAYIEQGVTPDIVAEDLRLAYLLYTSDSPIGEPYRELHLWVDVYEPGTEPTGE
ncbi:DUF1616 domain-containing protein [Halalkalicoccus jeotgali]|uniref:DUF1616 domain-containing protein n=1 Tax=Halalkalicoccus jeotgali (strain DSM 18796 / CECT 7217 / JCM 14584 / KCTC 4019 / B3) TaxID=795797 RepID=D8J448_HALJB|nr:DUF1616 domain-containing protein [Halalkalicoccus jeotgali]ADJ15440.1 hypothetical protein HacjB3_10285 [Halalkalicoccus jeotgali B3]ELY36151.1 hypothetical protein C497_12382 [Halalkalicoccus jeotgali B3]